MQNGKMTRNATTSAGRMESQKIRFCIDRGGTFTDCVAMAQDGTVHVCKLLSEDPLNYPDAPREGIRRLLERVTGEPHRKDLPLDTFHIASIRMATTVATNALLERKGEPFALFITRGFRDLLQIGNQARPNIFDLAIRSPEVLYDAVVEVDERVTLVGYSAGGKTTMQVPEHDPRLRFGVTGEALTVIQELDEVQVRRQLEEVYSRGIRSIAVALMHSYTFPEHEHAIGRLAAEVGISHVTLSSQLTPMIKLVPRGMSACVDAYLTPCIQRYLRSFAEGFDEGLARVPVQFMQSDGGLTPMQDFSGFRAILSGPAGGVVGYARTTWNTRDGTPVIGFDMGGTSTDVSRFAGNYERVFETTTAGITIQAPQLDINTVAAGGGSRLFYRNGLLAVGPESAGAHPGPACYRKGGPLTITDANLVLGRLIPDFFPHIFGPHENDPLDVDAAFTAMQALADEVNAAASSSKTSSLSLDDVAFGFVKVANESMCRPIRALTQAKGFDTKKHVLACFGGAGGQHACAIARALGIGKIFIHQYSSVLSAFGLALADVAHEEQEPCADVFSDETKPALEHRIANLTAKCVAVLQKQGFSKDSITIEAFLNLRYQGTDCAVMTRVDGTNGVDVAGKFAANYQREFGFTLTGRDLIVDDIRVRASGASGISDEFQDDAMMAYSTLDCRKAVVTRSVYFDGGRQPTPVFRLEDIATRVEICGPCIILDANSTILVEPNCTARITERKNIVIIIGSGLAATVGMELDPIQLSIFSHRFMGIAEQMGRTLQRTSISTNIKERLDFSCALFGPDGGLVANAPHIPVHLGAMQEAVKYQLIHYGADLRPGDVLVANHPMAGGSHLPDITVMTPVFKEGAIAFFVASRGHHADIGGISPGSMPPNSTTLAEEGAAIKSFKLVDGGVFQEQGITKLLLHDPALHPGCSGTRNLRDNISDLKAQVAANNRGILLVQELMEEYGLDVVTAYMQHIRANAELAVRTLLKGIVAERGHGASTTTLSATDYMDDGSAIQLRVTIDGRDGSAEFDFAGTGYQVYGNTNAPPSVAYSAVIYCLRCMVGTDIPLNQGCLAPIRFSIPPQSLLCPSDNAAVVGGNVLTSQRLVDVVLRAFEACAASQGCMNNLTFGMAPDVERGRDGWGYYETIAGGSGAGVTWQGRDGVHTHMTNTRITDPEILERRYPVILHRFEIRQGSGGTGVNRGGHGLIRELEFYESIKVSILSERRVFRPYGLHGGGDGERGENLLIARDGRVVNLGGKATFTMDAGDRLRISTPGGGGYGGV